MRLTGKGLPVLAMSAVAAATLAGCRLAPSKAVDLPPPEHPPGEAHKAVRHGHELFHEYCASCHGVTAEGNGPLAVELRRAPADLTRIAQRRGGVFPEHEIHEIIDGRRRVRGHGSAEMPVWGRRFSSAYAGGAGYEDEVIVRMRILEVVNYLKSIQIEE